MPVNETDAKKNYIVLPNMHKQTVPKNGGEVCLDKSRVLSLSVLFTHYNLADD